MHLFNRSRFKQSTSGVFAQLAQAAGCVLLVALNTNVAQAQTNSIASGMATQAVDPGVRTGQASVGGPLPGLTSEYQQFFTAALARFQEVDSVSGGLANETGVGLGPRFNGNSCAGCHAYPAVGGSSPAENPQVALATLDGATNRVPPFITMDGPVREARFIRNTNGTPDGGVHNLFVISGRTDAGSCNIAQPDFTREMAEGNVVLRIPTPLYGDGLVEAITDAALKANAINANRAGFGISGEPNLSGNDGTITRFGWKAQNKSIMMFAGEAYNVEQGVTNELFPNERDETPGCMMNALPEDLTNTETSGGFPPSDYSSDLVNFAAFARLSAPPSPAPLTQQAAAGQQIFNQIGCNLCHTPSINPGSKSPYTGTNNPAVNAFSDFMLHNMGTGLADHVSQGVANGMEFRTAPLWGLGQRIYFLHDGRTKNLVAAIEAHRSSGSEANQVINNFLQLSKAQAQALLVFLRSL